MRYEPKCLNFGKKWLKINFGAEISDFYCLVMRERERKKNPNFSLQSTEFCLSEFIGTRIKVNPLDEGYTWILKTWDFAEDSSEFGKSKISGLGSVHGTS